MRLGLSLALTRRRGGAFSPLVNLAAKLGLSFNADAGVVVGTGAASWTDEKAGYAVAQATGSAQPTPTTLGGKTFLRFTAAASQSLSNVTALSTVLGAPGAFEIVTVVQFASLAVAVNFGAPGIVRTTGSNRVSCSASTTGVYANVATTVAGGSVASATAPTTGITYRTRARFDGAALVGAKLGSGAEATAAATAAQDSANYDFGLYMGGVLGAPFLDAYVRRIYWFKAELTAGERAALDAWLAADTPGLVV